MEWLEDNSWRKKHNTKDIYLMVNHKWAFVIWEIARIRKTINEKAILIHVDSHLDDVPELVEDERYFSANSIEDFLRLAEYERSELDEDEFTTNYELRMDNFIIPSFLRGTIQDIMYVSDQKLDEIRVEHMENAARENKKDYTNMSGDTNDYILNKCYRRIEGQDKSIERYYSVEEYLEEIDLLPPNQSKILDLDLDYFNDSNNTLVPNLKSDEVIRDNLKRLKEHCDWDMITVALSPLYCGGDEECMHILKLFLETFELNIDDFNDWQ